MKSNGHGRRERTRLTTHDSATLRHAWLVRLQMLKADAVWLLDPTANWPLSNTERSELARIARHIKKIAFDRLVRARALIVDTHDVPNAPPDEALRERIATLQSLTEDLRDQRANWPLTEIERDQIERVTCELERLLLDVLARAGAPTDELERRHARLDQRMRSLRRKSAAKALVPIPVDHRPMRILQLATA